MSSAKPNLENISFRVLTLAFVCFVLSCTNLGIYAKDLKLVKKIKSAKFGFSSLVKMT